MNLQDLEQGLGEDMLASVLLHMVESLLPIDLPDYGPIDFPFTDMDNLSVLAQDINYAGAIQSANISRLPPSGRVEACSIQYDAYAMFRFRLARDLSIEPPLVGICVVQFLSHAYLPINHRTKRRNAGVVRRRGLGVPLGDADPLLDHGCYVTSLLS